VGPFGIGALFALMAFRTPDAIAILLVGFFGKGVLGGFKAAGGVLLTESFVFADRVPDVHPLWQHRLGSGVQPGPV